MTSNLLHYGLVILAALVLLVGLPILVWLERRDPIPTHRERTTCRGHR